MRTAPLQPVARLRAPGDVRVDDEPPPTLGPGEVLLRVTSVGLCGSDLHWYADGAIGETRLDRPLVLGHEIAAVIAEGPRRGTRVAVDPADPCGDCPICRGGHEELCPAMRFAGHGTTDGGLRGLMSWPERLLHPVPDSIGDAEASLLEALGVALHAIDLGAVTPGMRGAVVGCGPIGLLVIGALRATGIDDVVACDVLPHRVEAAIQIAAPAGRVVLVGIPADDRTTFTASTARRKGLTLVLCRRMTAADLDRAIALATSGRIDLSSLITDSFALEEAPRAFAALAARRGLKVVVQPAGAA